MGTGAGRGKAGAASEMRRQADEHLLFYGREFSEPVIVKAQGSYIYDETGREYIDGRNWPCFCKPGCAIEFARLAADSGFRISAELAR